MDSGRTISRLSKSVAAFGSMPDSAAHGDLMGIAIRLEDALVGSGAPSGDRVRLAGRIEQLTFQGGQIECRVRVGNGVVRTVLDPSTMAKAGDPRGLAIDPRAQRRAAPPARLREELRDRAARASISD